MFTSTRSQARGASAVVTFVTPSERQRVDALTNGRCVAVHRENLEQVLRDLRTNRVSAVIVSVSRYQQQYAPSVARMVREFPQVPAVALLTASETRTPAALLSLGEHGVRTLVDARDPAGWRTLRTLVSSEAPRDIEALAISTLRQDLDGASASSVRFFDTLFTVPRSMTTVQQLARHIGVVPTTLMSRFLRHGVPTPKRYLAAARLVRAAHLLENPGFSITQVAFLMEYSSPQSFSRHVTGILQVGAAEFRRRYTGESMLQAMRSSLVLPYLEQLRHFDPFASPPQWLSRPGSDVESELVSTNAAD
ncbi:helix-turn-helix transcriptional regulator [Gemmatimonas sp.]